MKAAQRVLSNGTMNGRKGIVEHTDDRQITKELMSDKCGCCWAIEGDVG